MGSINSAKKLFRDRVHSTLKDWGEPITVTDVLKCMDIVETQKNRHRILCAISSLKHKDGVSIKATATGNKKGRVYELVNGSARDSVDEYKDDQTFEKLAESARQKEIAEESLETTTPKPSKSYGRSNPLFQERPAKELKAYEDLCFHYINSRKGLTSSVQVADYYELTNEEGACLLNRVSKKFSGVKITVYAQACI